MAGLEFIAADLEDPLQMALAVRFRYDLYAAATASQKGSFESKWPSVGAYKKHLLEHQKHDVRFVGFVQLSQEIIGHYVMDEHFTLAETGYLEVLYLTPFARGKGYGFKIIEYARHLLRGRDFKKLRTVSDRTNQKVTAFYEECGFMCLGLNNDRVPPLLLWEQKL